MLVESPSVELGWLAAPFKLKSPNGDSYRLDELKGKNGTLVAFICNHCPYVIATIDRMVQDAALLQEAGIGVVAINSNDFEKYPADSPENMALFAERHKMTFPYLIDEDQSVANTYDAVCTPDFFGFNADGELQYRGRLDDARMGDASNRQADLLDAMRLIVKTGQGPEKQYPSMGCSIKWF